MTGLIESVRVTPDNVASVARILRQRSRVDSQTREAVERIVGEVRKGRDSALRRYCLEFDLLDPSEGGYRVEDSEIDRAFERVGRGTIRALNYSMRRVSRVQRELIKRVSLSVRVSGFQVSASLKPIPSVGCYVPGGRASYASSVIMTAGVASTAGVGRIVVCTPPSRGGRVADEVLAAARVAGADEVFRIGGAHSIAAMAYGTESVEPVSKIVGPGGRYVSAAKEIVSSDVPIDFFAGPTEILLYADESCPPRTAAWDLISQAEHGTETFCGLVSLTEGYASKVRGEIARLLPSLGRREHVSGALASGFAAVCDDESTACDFIEAISPEHLEILVRDPSRVASRIAGPGLKLLGQYSPCSASDYIVGTDHVIPTGGLAGSRGPLSALDFMKLDWSVRGSRAGLKSSLCALKALSEAEGLGNHYAAAESRFRRGKAA